jgi:F5/8 type C domain
MRKRIVNPEAEGVSNADKDWLDLEGLAQAEVSSEDAAHPIESALLASTGSGWRAAQPGKQTIRLLFDKPLKIRTIRLVFQEDEQERTQEFVLRWSSDGGQAYREIARQQYNFSPGGSNREQEDYTVDLNGLTTLELIIVPDISRGSAHASIAQLRLA